MLKLATFSALAVLLSGGPTANAKEHGATVARGCPGIVHGLYFYRNATHKWESKLHRHWTKSSFNASKVLSCRYATWVAHRWMKRAHKGRVSYVQRLHRLQQLQKQKQRQLQSVLADPVRAICSVFGPYCSQAIAVATCEGDLNPYAQNGQYLGTFQMGESERATYGHGYTVYEQAKAAYAYFVDSGRDWSPWSCQPS